MMSRFGMARCTTAAATVFTTPALGSTLSRTSFNPAALVSTTARFIAVPSGPQEGTAAGSATLAAAAAATATATVAAETPISTTATATKSVLPTRSVINEAQHKLYQTPVIAATTSAVHQMSATMAEWQSDHRIVDGPLHFVGTWICVLTVVACCLAGYQRVHAAQLDADPTLPELNTQLMLGWETESRTTSTPVGI